MKCPKFILSFGTKVVTCKTLETTAGMLVPQHHLDLRRAGAEGTIAGVVGGHGGDVYWVRHGGLAGDLAAYCWSELDLAQPERVSAAKEDLGASKPFDLPVGKR